MRVGFFGNTNNYPFMLARAVRALGHDVSFIVNRGERLHRPENRYDDITVPYPPWIHDIRLDRARNIVLPSPERRQAIDVLNRCDAVVANGFGPAVVCGLGRPTVVVLTGSDLEQLADPIAATRVVTPDRMLPRWLRRIGFLRLVRRQRRAIAESTAVTFFPRGLMKNGDRILDELGVDDSRRLFFLQADVHAIAARPMPDNATLRVFCVSRLTWKQPAPGAGEFDFKGTDVLVRGVAMYHRDTERPLELHLVRKGLHVSETESLVRDEGVEHLVVWRDELTQREVLDEYAAADVVADQFSKALVGMGGLEAMATGRPLLANGHPEIFEPIHGPSPICQARTPDEVAQQLVRLSDRSTRERIGRESRAHVERCFSPKAAADLVMTRIENELGGSHE